MDGRLGRGEHVVTTSAEHQRVSVAGAHGRVPKPRFIERERHREPAQRMHVEEPGVGERFAIVAVAAVEEHVRVGDRRERVPGPRAWLLARVKRQPTEQVRKLNTDQ